MTGAPNYLAGASVSIKAVATAGYRFDKWTAPAGTFVNANAAETTFTMPAQAVTVTANFASTLHPHHGRITDWRRRYGG